MQIARLISRCIACAAIGAASVTHAGELGATSRASISISITIPPHLSVHELAAASTSRNSGLARRQFCVASKGIGTYSITRLTGQEVPSDAATRPHMAPSAIVAWSDGQIAAKVGIGKTVSGFNPGISSGCDRGEMGAASLTMTSGDSAAQTNQVNGPVTLIIGAD